MNRTVPCILMVTILLLSLPSGAQSVWRLKATSFYTLQWWGGHGLSDSAIYFYTAPTDTSFRELRFLKVQSDRSLRWEGVADYVQYTPSGDSLLVEKRLYDTVAGTFHVMGTHQYAYNAQGFRSSATELKFDSIQNRNRNVRRDVFSYDSAGRMLERTTQLGDASGLVWNNYGLTRWRYNATGRPRTQAGYFWNSGQNRFLLNDSTIYAHDASDTVYLGYLVWMRNTRNNRIFQYYRERVDSVDAAGRTLQTYEERYDTSTAAWIPGSGVRYSYDIRGRVTKRLIGFWQASTSSYDYRAQTEYFYHTPSGKLQKIFYTALNSSPAYFQETNYYYEAPGLDVAGPLRSTGAALNAYPQPAADQLTLRVALNTPQPYSISILDLQGRRLQQLNGLTGVSSQLQVPVHNLPPGTYVAVLQGESGAYATSRFVVQR